MTENEARNVIQQTIYDASITGISNKSTQIAWQGLPFSGPTNLPWINITVVHLSSNQLTIGPGGGPGVGSRKYRRNGNVIVQCFVPARTGSQDEVVTIAREVKNLFEGATISTIRFSDATIQEAPPQEAEWLQANAIVVFQYDEQK